MKQKIRGLILTIILVFCMTVPAAAATQGYRFEQKTVSLQVGKSKSLTVYNNGRKVNPGKIRWKSSNPDKVSVTKGTLTAKKWGTARISAVYGGKTIYCTVYVYNKNTRTNFKGYKASSAKIKVGSKLQLKPEIQGKTTTYKTSNSKIATISSNGILTAKTPGTVNITCVSFGKYRYTASLKVTVGAELKSIKAADEIVMDKGTQKDISVSVSPRNAYVRSITYTLSNNSVVTVSKTGRIFAKAPGLVKITVTVNSGQTIKKQTIQVYVQNKAAVSDAPLSGSTGTILHRGLSLEAPENSIPAFKLAGQKGAQYIETDVRQLRDGTFVIFHDGNLQRMCGVNKKIEDLTYQEVKKYPIITGTNASAYKNNVIPTLEQYLKCCNQYSATPVIEIKSQLNSAGVAKFNRIIKMSKKSPVVISFKEEPLKMLRQINRNISIQLILRDQITNAALDECSRYKFDVSAQYQCTNKAVIKRAHSRNIKVALWLFTDSKIADCYRNWGVDYITCERIM